MSHTDIIRAGIWPVADHIQRADAREALDALVAIIEQQADRIAWLEGDVAGWRIKLAVAQAELQRRPP